MLIQLLVNSLNFGVCLNLSTLITLTAKIYFVFRCSALYTFPYCPLPMLSISIQSQTTLFILNDLYYNRTFLQINVQVYTTHLRVSQMKLFQQIWRLAFQYRYIYFKMSSDQALALWKSQIPFYERVILRCCNQIQIPLTRFLPTNFDQKIQQFKDILSIKDPQECQHYIDVVVHFIQGVKNKSIIQLADLLVQELGGTLKFWQNIIIDVAEQVSYTSQLSIWQVRKIYEEKLYIDSENLSNQRRLCKITKIYLTALINLTKTITKFDSKKDNINRIDDLFKKVKSAEQKYVSFSEQIKGLQMTDTMDELSNNITQRSKQNALKNLYHFKQPNKIQKQDKKRNTLLNYKFKVNNKQPVLRVSGPTKNIKQTNKSMTGNRLQKFQVALKNIKDPPIKSLGQLKQQFKASKKEQQITTTFSNNFTTIWDKDYFFSYLGHPIEMQEFYQFTHPFETHKWINYEIQSDDEYQDLIGEDVQNNSQVSSISEDSKISFIVSDDHLSEDEDQDQQRKDIKPKININFANRWFFMNHKYSESAKENLNAYQMILVDSKSKFPIQILNTDEDVLARIVQGKDKLSIMDALSKEKIKISKAKIKQFLQKKCKVVTSQSNPNIIIYRVIQQLSQHQEEQKENNSKECEYIPNQGEQKDELNDYDQTKQYFSQVEEKRITRASKKGQSQKLSNNRRPMQTRLSKRRSSGQSKEINSI